KYEEDVPGGGAGGGAPRTSPSLSSFLIGRAAESVELANYLYWYLRVEMANPVYESHYREVYEEFRERLSRVKVRDRAIVKEEDEGGEEDGAAGDDDGPAATLWDLLADQDDFITGIMECQSEARLARGKKDAKEAAFRDLLERRGLGRIPRPVPLPSDPRVWVRGVDPGSIRMFKSALYPAVLDFVVDEDRGGGEGGGDEETAPAAAAAPTIKVMVKTGDDLRQDQLVIMMIRLMDRLLKRSALDLCLRPYSILAMPDDSGLMEFVNDSVPVSQVLASHSGNSILSYFRSVAPSPGGDDGGGGGGGSRGVRPEVLQAYVRSCAGYCVLTYLLGVGDRHLDNIMIQPTGNFFHIGECLLFLPEPDIFGLFCSNASSAWVHVLGERGPRRACTEICFSLPPTVHFSWQIGLSIACIQTLGSYSDGIQSHSRRHSGSQRRYVEAFFYPRTDVSASSPMFRAHVETLIRI
ncbi:hypothetical protein THAOC_11036, partial [Thalassiosira oceanica]